MIREIKDMMGNHININDSIIFTTCHVSNVGKLVIGKVLNIVDEENIFVYVNDEKNYFNVNPKNQVLVM